MTRQPRSNAAGLARSDRRGHQPLRLRPDQLRGSGLARESRGRNTGQGNQARTGELTVRSWSVCWDMDFDGDTPREAAQAALAHLRSEEGVTFVVRPLPEDGIVSTDPGAEEWVHLS